MKGPSKKITEGIDRLYETFTEPLTLKEIADACGCSHTAILNIEKAALAKLADKFKERGIVRNNYGGKVAKYGSRVTRPGDIPSEYVPPVFNEEKYERECDFRYSTQFRAYKLVLETILRKADRPLNTGDIKRVMGEQFRPEWHQDAIEMSKHILVFWGYPDHYAWYAGEITEERKVEWNGRIAPPSKPVADLGLEGRILA